MADVVEGAVDTFRAVLDADRTQHRRSSVPEDLPLVAADRDRVGQVLINLISNAIKYSPERRRRHGRPRKRPRSCVISVTDTGPRHQPRRPEAAVHEVLPRRLGDDPRDRRHRAGAVDLQEHHRAARREDLAAKRKPARARRSGSRCPWRRAELVRTPVRSQGPLTVGRHRARRRPRPGGRRRSSRRTCGKRGYDVLKAHTAEEALALAQPRAAATSITLDVILDDGDGFELLQRLKERPGDRRDIPVVVLSIVCDEGRAAGWARRTTSRSRSTRGGCSRSSTTLVGSVDVAGRARGRRRPRRRRACSPRRCAARASRWPRPTTAPRRWPRSSSRCPTSCCSTCKMPKMDGYEVIQAREDDPEWRRHPDRGHDGAPHRPRARSTSSQLADEQLDKPLSPDGIADAGRGSCSPE